MPDARQFEFGDSTPYRGNPIVEVVLAIHFADAIPLKIIDAFFAKRRAKFPLGKDIIGTKFEPNLKDSHKNISRKKVGIKLYNELGKDPGTYPR